MLGRITKNWICTQCAADKGVWRQCDCVYSELRLVSTAYSSVWAMAEVRVHAAFTVRDVESFLAATRPMVVATQVWQPLTELTSPQQVPVQRNRLELM